MLLTKYMLQRHRQRHEQGNSQEGTYRAPEPRAKRDGKKHGEGIYLESSAHKSWRDELALDCYDRQVGKRRYGRLLQRRKNQQSNDGQGANDDGWAEVGI